MAVEILTQRIARRSPVDLQNTRTIVSIYPKPVNQVYATLTPDLYELKAGSVKEPAVLTVTSASWFRDPGYPMEFMERVVQPLELAEAFVTDYVKDMPGITPEAKPGLFFIEKIGSFTPDDIRTKFKDALTRATVFQENWYKEMVRQGDVEWSRGKENPLYVSNLSRMAALELGVSDKPWLKDFKNYERQQCAACGQYNAPELIICPNCKFIIDEKKFEAIKGRFAK